MESEIVRFEPLRRARGWYYVEYFPPMPEYRFSTLQITCLEDKPDAVIAEAMELEARRWIREYPIPVMVSAFSIAGDLIGLDSVRPCSHLIGWDERPNAEALLHWRLVPNSELPDIALDRDFVENLFSSLPHTTRDEVAARADRHQKSMRWGWWLVFTWSVLVPLAVAVIEWSSDLLGLAVLAYAFIKAGKLALTLTGKLPKSNAEREKEAEVLAMKHHHYHCKRNPEGFAKLKAENFRRDEVERALATAQALECNGSDAKTNG